MDTAGLADELMQWGAPAEVLARLDSARAAQEIEVLECNWTTVRVWLNCTPEFAGMGQRVGIPATEVRAALSVMRIPRAEWAQVLEGVRVMDRACAS